MCSRHKHTPFVRKDHVLDAPSQHSLHVRVGMVLEPPRIDQIPNAELPPYATKLHLDESAELGWAWAA